MQGGSQAQVMGRNGSELAWIDHQLDQHIAFSSLYSIVDPILYQYFNIISLYQLMQQIIINHQCPLQQFTYFKQQHVALLVYFPGGVFGKFYCHFIQCNAIFSIADIVYQQNIVIFMINAVSDRIRSIIKSQDNAHQQALLVRSRENSMDSGRSGQNFKNNGLPYHHPPKSPHKGNSHKSEENTQPVETTYEIQNSNIGIKNNNCMNGQSLLQDSQLIQKLKLKVIESLYPFLTELSKKVQALSDMQGLIKNSLTQIDDQFRVLGLETQSQVQKIGVRVDAIQYKLQAKQQQHEQAIYQQIVKLQQQQQNMNRKLQKVIICINTGLVPNKILKQTQSHFVKLKQRQRQQKSSINNFSPQSSINTTPMNMKKNNNDFKIGLKTINKSNSLYEYMFDYKQQVSAKLQEKHTSNRKNQTLRYSSKPNPMSHDVSKPIYMPAKCKCQNLVQQILQSQNHLMMELKFIKHGVTVLESKDREREVERQRQIGQRINSFSYKLGY